MRAGERMSQKCADLVRRLGRENMLKLAGLLLDFGFAVHRQAVGKKPLRKPVATNNISGPLAAARSQFNNLVAISG